MSGRARAAHAPARPARPSCRFFKRGHCRNGPNCGFSHVTGGERAAERRDGPRGGAAPRTRREQEAAPPPPLPPARGVRAERQQRPPQQRKRERPECSVCFEAPPESSGRYGLLENCDHSLCLNCARSWRAGARDDPDALPHNSVRRACPVCRTKSDFVTPSIDFVTGMDKLRVIENYKASMAKIPCKYYSATQSCQFGSHCFYKHVRLDGTVLDKEEERRMEERQRRNLASRTRQLQRRAVDDDPYRSVLNMFRDINFGIFNDELEADELPHLWEDDVSFGIRPGADSGRHRSDLYLFLTGQSSGIDEFYDPFL